MIEITKTLAIPSEEVIMTATRSRGPGGQNVNKVNTRVMLRFSVWSSKALSEAQKATIASRLKSRMTKEGVLYLQAQGMRSQAANRTILLSRFASLLREALRPVKPRKATQVPHRVIEHRLQEKKLRSHRKESRRRPVTIEE